MTEVVGLKIVRLALISAGLSHPLEIHSNFAIAEPHSTALFETLYFPRTLHLPWLCLLLSDALRLKTRLRR